MKSASNCREKHQNHFLKKEKFHCLANTASLFFYSTCLTITALFCFHLLFYHRNIKYTTNIQEYNRSHTFIQPKKGRFPSTLLITKIHFSCTWNSSISVCCKISLQTAKPAIYSKGNGFQTRQVLYIQITAAQQFRS